MSDVSPYLDASDDDIPTVVSLSLMGTCQVSICLGKAIGALLWPAIVTLRYLLTFMPFVEKSRPPPDLIDDGYWCPALACYCNFEIPFDIYAFCREIEAWKEDLGNKDGRPQPYVTESGRMAECDNSLLQQPPRSPPQQSGRMAECDNSLLQHPPRSQPQRKEDLGNNDGRSQPYVTVFIRRKIPAKIDKYTAGDEDEPLQFKMLRKWVGLKFTSVILSVKDSLLSNFLLTLQLAFHLGQAPLKIRCNVKVQRYNLCFK
nr:hypothetical protein [Tanacetum cinerariifolium]